MTKKKRLSNGSTLLSYIEVIDHMASLRSSKNSQKSILYNIHDKINKMKMKLAAQLFSHRVAIAVRHICDAGKLDSECRALIPFVLLIYKLFDS